MERALLGIRRIDRRVDRIFCRRFCADNLRLEPRVDHERAQPGGRQAGRIRRDRQQRLHGRRQDEARRDRERSDRRHVCVGGAGAAALRRRSRVWIGRRPVGRPARVSLPRPRELDRLAPVGAFRRRVARVPFRGLPPLARVRIGGRLHVRSRQDEARRDRKRSDRRPDSSRDSRRSRRRDRQQRLHGRRQDEARRDRERSDRRHVCVGGAGAAALRRRSRVWIGRSVPRSSALHGVCPKERRSVHWSRLDDVSLRRWGFILRRREVLQRRSRRQLRECRRDRWDPRRAFD